MSSERKAIHFFVGLFNHVMHVKRIEGLYLDYVTTHERVLLDDAGLVCDKPMLSLIDFTSASVNSVLREGSAFLLTISPIS